jgi:hypothetical protein
MSFLHTLAQIRSRTKTVTRRMGWTFLRPGDRVVAVRRLRGCKPGEAIERLATLEVVSVRRERLNAIDEADVRREGFSLLTAAAFVAFYCEMMQCKSGTLVTRIEFRYLEDAIT